MFNVSSRFKRIVDQPGREFWYKVKLELKSGKKMELESCDIMEGGLSVEQSASLIGSFTLGGIAPSELSLQLNNYARKFDGVDFDRATIIPYVGLIVEENYETGAVPEWVKLGTFTAETADTRGSVVKIKALDTIMKFDVNYAQCSLSYPATLHQILESCCLDCGVPLLTHNFINADYVVDTRPEDATMAYRDMVAYVAQLAGCFARMTPDGALELAWYDMEHPVIQIRDVEELWTQDITITGVKLKSWTEETEKLYGEEGYVLELTKNQLLQKNVDAVGRALEQKLKGMTFCPFSHLGWSNPSVQVGDTAIILGRDQKPRMAAISWVLYQAGEQQRYACEAESPLQRQRSTCTAVDVAREFSKTDTKRQISTYDTLAKQFGAMTANSMGFYQTTEKQDDGSEIWYQHDKPLLEESKVIWKKSLDTMAVSTDGGKTWQGMDKNGNAVLNVLAAHGIVADWIKTGRIEARTGGAYLDLDSGEASVTNLHKHVDPQGSMPGADYDVYIGRNPVSEMPAYGLVMLVDGKLKGWLSAPHTGSAPEIGFAFGKGKYSRISFGERGMTLSTGVFSDSGGGASDLPTVELDEYWSTLHCNLTIKESLEVGGSLSVKGDRQRIVETSSGLVGVSAYETAEPYFGDLGESKTGKNGIAKVPLDPLFTETVNAKDYPYQVFLQPYTEGHFWVAERTADYFVVNGPASGSFAWEVKARQKGFESKRLQTID